MFQHWVLILSLSFQVGILHCQPEKIVFDYYGTQEGFNTNVAHDVATTSDGMVWISTKDGLVRYDSKRFKFYQHHSYDSTSISFNECFDLCVDKRDWIWLKSRNELNLFDPATEKFSTIRIRDSRNIKFATEPISFSYDTANDIIWVGTNHGLFFSQSGSKELQFVRGPGADSMAFRIPVQTIQLDQNNRVWLTSGKNILCFDPITKNILSTRIPTIVDGVINNAYSKALTSYIDRNEILWLGSWISGLISYDTRTNTFHQYTISDPKTFNNSIFNIAQTGLPGQDNIIWFSSEFFGLVAFNIDTHQFTQYQAKTNNDIYGVRGTVFGLHTVRSEGMWICTSTGLYRYDYSKQLFKTIDFKDLTTPDQTLGPIYSFDLAKGTSGKEEQVWMHIPYFRGFIYDLKRNQIFQPPKQIAKYLANETGLFDFFIDSKNTIWIGTNQYGLIGFNIDRQEFVLTEKKFFFEEYHWANSFYEDSQGKLWIGSFLDGLYYMDSLRQQVNPAESLNKEMNVQNSSVSFIGMTEDLIGNIWFIANNNEYPNCAIGYYTTSTNQTVLVYHQGKNDTSKPELSALNDIVCDKKGIIYVATKDMGIFWFDSTEKNPAFHPLNTENGLLTNQVYSLEVDAENRVWCATSIGISCYLPHLKNFINFPYEAYFMDYLPAEYIRYSNATGRIYMPQITSFIYFDTKEVRNTTRPLLKLLDFKVFNRSIKKNDQPINFSRKIYLSYQQNSISVEFALLSYTNSFNNRYSWKLKGIEAEWTTSKENIATYTNLNPGEYTLLLKAANSTGEWSKETIALTFVIRPPFYLTWWFIMLVILFIAGMIYYLWQLKLNRIQERFRLRNKIAMDLHDEIGSTLTSINILSKISKNSIHKSPLQAAEMMDQINTQSKTIQQNMSDIVWAIRPDNDKLENLLIRMREYTAQTLEVQLIKITFDVDETLLNKSLSLEQRKELLLIFKEAINNIVKHAGATEVLVRLSKQQKMLQLEIQDNGHWSDLKKTTGTGVRSMQQRAESMGAGLKMEVSAQGTNITLTMPLT